MIGGTLVASKALKLHSYFRNRFEELGFKDVVVTDAEKDGLNMAIDDMKPRILLIGSSFYECCTPFMMTSLHKRFPKLNIAAISISKYPARLAAKFINAGVKSYANFYEGDKEFFMGLEEIRKGNVYISPEVQESINKRSHFPDPSDKLTDQQLEVTRLICNGFKGKEIADVLAISERTVDKHKENIFNIVSVRNENELIRVALYLGYIKLDELSFYGRDYMASPKPANRQTLRRTA